MTMALADTKRAIRLVRSRGGGMETIAPERVGVDRVFLRGGELAALFWYAALTTANKRRRGLN